MLRRIRYVFETGSFDELKDAVEVDEAYIGASIAISTQLNGQSISRIKVLKALGGKNSKTPVVGMVERGGRLDVVATKGTDSNTLMTLIRRQLDINATVYTDEHIPCLT